MPSATPDATFPPARVSSVRELREAVRRAIAAREAAADGAQVERIELLCIDEVCVEPAPVCGHCVLLCLYTHTHTCLCTLTHIRNTTSVVPKHEPQSPHIHTPN